METVTDFIFLGSKITAGGDCSHEIERHLLLERKAMTNLDSILNSRDYFANKGLSSQSYGFSSSHVWMWELDIKKAEHWRIDAFELWCWRRLLRVPRTARRSNQSVLKEISPEYSLEGLMLKLKLQYFGYLMQSPDSLEKTLILGKIEGRKRRGQQERDGWMASLTRWTWVWASSRRWWWTGKPGMLQSMGSQRVGQDWAPEQQYIVYRMSICNNAILYMNINVSMVVLYLKSIKVFVGTIGKTVPNYRQFSGMLFLLTSIAGNTTAFHFSSLHSPLSPELFTTS